MRTPCPRTAPGSTMAEGWIAVSAIRGVAAQVHHGGELGLRADLAVHLGRPFLRTQLAADQAQGQRGARIADARIAVAESLTSGNIAARLGRGQNASQWFAGAVVAYSVDVKTTVLGMTRGLDPVSGARRLRGRHRHAAQAAPGCRNRRGRRLARHRTRRGRGR